MGSNTGFFRRLVGDWGSKRRKQDVRERQGMKEEAETQLLQATTFQSQIDGSFLDGEKGAEYNSPLDQLPPEYRYTCQVKRPGDAQADVVRLKAEIKNLKQEVSKWKAKYKAAQNAWFTHWRYNKHEDVQVVVARLQSEWDEIRRAE